MPSRSAGLQRAELALREVFGGADAEARLKLALQMRGAEADRRRELVQRGLAAVQQLRGRVRVLVGSMAKVRAHWAPAIRLLHPVHGAQSDSGRHLKAPAIRILASSAASGTFSRGDGTR